jgi:hypothetical protein
MMPTTVARRSPRVVKMAVEVKRGALTKEAFNHLALGGKKPVEWMMPKHDADCAI